MFQLCSQEAFANPFECQLLVFIPPFSLVKLSQWANWQSPGSFLKMFLIIPPILSFSLIVCNQVKNLHMLECCVPETLIRYHNCINQVLMCLLQTLYRIWDLQCRNIKIARSDLLNEKYKAWLLLSLVSFFGLCFIHPDLYKRRSLWVFCNSLSAFCP